MFAPISAGSVLVGTGNGIAQGYDCRHSSQSSRRVAA
jgi:hypothetical protein